MGCERKLSNIFSLISVAAAPALGVLAGILFNMGMLPGIVTGVWIAVAVAALALAGLIAGTAIGAENRSGKQCGCLPCRIGSLVAAIAGVLLTGTVALVVGLTVGSLLSAVLVGFGAFFFVFLIIQAIDLVICLVASACCR